MDQLMSDSTLMSEFVKYLQSYYTARSQVIPQANKVYLFHASVSSEVLSGASSENSKMERNDIPNISNLDMETTIYTDSNMEIVALYNNSLKTEKFQMSIRSNLGKSDALAMVQYNDMKPDLDQILFVKSQEMILSELINVELKPNDCIIFVLGKLQNDGNVVAANLKIVGGEVSHSTDKKDEKVRKIVVSVLMIIVMIAIAVLIYSLMNPPKLGFRRRR